MKTYPCILSIAGSDSSGGAGIQADLKTISALGAYAATAVTAVTAQNTCGVTGIHPVPASCVAGQIEAVMTDLRPNALKIGMINDVEIVHVIAESIRKYRPAHVVFDPVMVSTSGSKLIEDGAMEAAVHELFPLSTIVTPNLSEAQALTRSTFSTPDAMIAAASQLLRHGSRAVLIKGGHLKGERMVDILQIEGENEPRFYEAPRIESPNTHGTGCTLSSAIATYLALGEPIHQAVRRAKEYVYKGIMAGKDVHLGQGHGPLNHFFLPRPMKIMETPDEQIDK